MSSFTYFVEDEAKTEGFSSEDPDFLEDTFRPSLFKRIDSDSSLQSEDFKANCVQEQSISNLNLSMLSKKEDKENWEVSMLTTAEKEKSTMAPIYSKCSEDEFEMSAKTIKYQLREAKSRMHTTQEQHTIELNYLNSKIDYWQQKSKDLEGKLKTLEDKTQSLTKDLLQKDKKIIWLESEIISKDSKIKQLSGLQAKIDKYKKKNILAKVFQEKIKAAEDQTEKLKKENKSLVAEMTKIKNYYSMEKNKIKEESEKSSRSLDVQVMLTERAESELARFREKVFKLEMENELMKKKAKNMHDACFYYESARVLQQT